MRPLVVSLPWRVTARSVRERRKPSAAVAGSQGRSPKYRQHVREADCIGVHFSPIPDPFPRIAWQNTIRLPPSRTYQVAETTINMVDALRGQQAQLRRLLAQKVLIGDAPKTTLSEMQALVIELHRLLAELERAIQDQLHQGRK
jgi:hypothetical protein